MNDARIVPITHRDLIRIYGEPVDASFVAAWAMVSDTDILGVSGLIRLSGETRLVGFLDIKKVSPSLGLMAYFAIKRWLIQHNENDVYITCDGQFAERFLAALRFVPTDEMRADYRNGEMKRVWRWHPY